MQRVSSSVCRLASMCRLQTPQAILHMRTHATHTHTHTHTRVGTPNVSSPTVSAASSPLAASGQVSVQHTGESLSFWQPKPANGYVVVTASPWYTPGLPFSQGLQVLPPGCSVRTHVHTDQHEVITCIRGQGSAIIRSVDKDNKDSIVESVHALLPGTTLTVCPGAVHSFHNVSPTDDLHFLWTITPGGLEDFFKSIGRPRSTSERIPPEPFERPHDSQKIDEKNKMKA